MKIYVLIIHIIIPNLIEDFVLTISKYQYMKKS